MPKSAPTQPRHRIRRPPFSPPSTWRPSRRRRLDSRLATGPKYTGEPISVNLKDVDLKDFFRLIHEISGLNVVLDPTVHGTLTVVLDDVPWDQALDIVLKNNDLARELEGNVLRIATVETLKHEADARRAQIESEALAVEKVSVTRFLSYAKAKDVIVTVKKFLSQRGDVVADDRTNAVIINDIPKAIPTIDRLLTQLDRKTQEVEIEARVVAATRQIRPRHRHAAWIRLGQRPQRDRRQRRRRFFSDDGQRPEPRLHHSTGQRRFHRRFVDSVVLEPGLNGPTSGLTLRERQQHRAYRCGALDGRVARLAESAFPSACRHSEQHSSPRETGRARADRDAGAVGWSSDRDLR